MRSVIAAALALFLAAPAIAAVVPSPVMTLDNSTVTATGGTTARTLANWFWHVDNDGTTWSINIGTTPSAVYSSIFPGVTFSDLNSTATLIPSGFSLEQQTGYAAYFRNQAAASSGGHNAVGLFAAGTCEVNSAACWGINTLLQDAPTRATGTGTGRVLTNEFDFNVMNPATTVSGINMTGSSLAQSTNANAFIVGLIGTGVTWTSGLITVDNAASTAISIGETGSGANANSQPVSWSTNDGAGVRQSVSLTAQAGNFFVLSGTAGANLKLSNGGVFTSSGNGVSFGSAAGNASIYADGSSNLSITAPTGKAIAINSPIILAQTTVAALPACSAGLKGALYGVTDAATPTYNGALTGGGTVAIPAYCNGTAWTAH